MSPSVAAPHAACPLPRPPRRRLWRAGLLVATAIALAGFTGVGCAVACRPSWHTPQAVDYARLPDDKRALVATVDAIGDALQSAEPHRVHLSADQVNRWIAARNELSPEEWLDAQLPNLERLPLPQVSFLPGGRLRLSFLAESAGFGSVVTLVVRIETAADEVLFTIDQVRLGVLPVPRSWVIEAARGWGDERISSAVDAGGVWRIPNGFVWPNGKRRFRVVGVSTSDNGATIEIRRAAVGP